MVNLSNYYNLGHSTQNMFWNIWRFGFQWWFQYLWWLVFLSPYPSPCYYCCLYLCQYDQFFNVIVFVVLPVVIRQSLMAKYFIYIGGMCDVPCNYITGIVLPWILGAIVNHLQIFLYLVNWTALGTSIIVQFICPIFMWSKSVKEADLFEQNFKSSLQMILEIDRECPTRKSLKD